MSEKIRAILSNWIVKNLLLALAALLLFVLVVNIVLGAVTRHNKEITVPDMTEMTISEAAQAASAAGIRVEIADSVYMLHARKGVVLSQLPAPGSRVKEGRRVLLTMVAKGSQKVTMPSLVGFSLRQARAELTTKGLVLGRLNYVPDIATNVVLKQMYRGSEIAPGRQIDAESRIDLFLGLNSEDSRAYVPNVIGQKYGKAIDAVRDNSLNLGRIRFDSSVHSYSDTLNARVYSQRPEADGMPLPMGSEVSLSLTVDPEKLGR